MLGEVDSPELSLGLGILSHILIGTPASPLRKALISSGLGEDLVGDGLETLLRQASYSVGLKGISPEDAKQVECLILDTLADLAQHGIDSDTIAASMNTIEFRLRENNTGQFPRGLSLMLRAMPGWLHNGDPLSRLAFDAPLAEVKDRLVRGERYFEKLIVDYWLENPHRVTVMLRPDPDLNLREEEYDRQRLLDC